MADVSHTSHPTARHAKAIEEIGNEAEVLFADATRSMFGVSVFQAIK